MTATAALRVTPVGQVWLERASGRADRPVRCSLGRTARSQPRAATIQTGHTNLHSVEFRFALAQNQPAGHLLPAAGQVAGGRAPALACRDSGVLGEVLRASVCLETLTSVAVGGARSATPLRPFRQVHHTLDAFSPARREFESNCTGSVSSSRVLSFRCSFTAQLHRHKNHLSNTCIDAFLGCER